ncbi:hypothetical protein VIGAN_07085900 [Vigna angularis var. angularis]|uniref:Uncharacterized protein n=1 Tax=Vigna angularis var. angularis TaxID=157739 RepID=A0A0S3SH70_PHAAN|nr:hypothetical protein VIGAN_07085900 [Vigna angularis var. angularis]
MNFIYSNLWECTPLFAYIRGVFCCKEATVIPKMEIPLSFQDRKMESMEVLKLVLLTKKKKETASMKVGGFLVFLASKLTYVAYETILSLTSVIHQLTMRLCIL